MELPPIVAGRDTEGHGLDGGTAHSGGGPSWLGGMRGTGSRMVRALPRREAAVTHEIAIVSRQLALDHQDPADRFLAATALVMGLTLVTADARPLNSEASNVLANR